MKLALIRTRALFRLCFLRVSSLSKSITRLSKSSLRLPKYSTPIERRVVACLALPLIAFGDAESSVRVCCHSLVVRAWSRSHGEHYNQTTR
jgi:hypothetical protein